MMGIQKEIDNFLAKNNLQKEAFTLISGDASFRKYARIGIYPNSYILMDTPKSEKPDEFIWIGKILERNGLSVPHIIDTDLDNGLILLSDLGTNSYHVAIDNGVNEEYLYRLAIDSLLKISKIKDYNGVALYDKKEREERLSLFTDWFMPAALGKETSSQVKEELLDIFENLFISIENAPYGLNLADFHIDNLMFLPDKTCGLLDFQDGFIGPLAYDLASLLEDIRRDIAPDFQTKMLDYYLSYLKQEEKETFLRSYHICAVKRHLRVIGIFTRLKKRDNKEKYLQFIPRTWRLLLSHLDEPYFKDFKNWLDKNIPTSCRTIPSSLLKDNK